MVLDPSDAYLGQLFGSFGLWMGISEYRNQKDPNPKLSGIQIEI